MMIKNFGELIALALPLLSVSWLIQLFIVEFDGGKYQQYIIQW